MSVNLFLTFLDEIENEANKCKELENKHEELEYQKLQLQAAKKSVEEDNIKLSSENVKFVVLVNELNDKLEKYKGLENSLFEAVTKKDDGDKQGNVEIGKKQRKNENGENNNEENPYRKKIKDCNVEDKKIEKNKEKNESEIVKLVKNESKKEKILIEEKDIRKSNLENDDKHTEKEGLKKTEKNELKNDSIKDLNKEKNASINNDLETPKIVEKNNLKDVESAKKVEIINYDMINSKITIDNSKEDHIKKEVLKNQINNEKIEVKEDDHIKPNSDLKNEVHVESKKVENVTINSDTKEHTKDGHIIQKIEVQSEKKVETNKSIANTNVIDTDHPKKNKEIINKNLESDKNINLVKNKNAKFENDDNKQIKKNIDYIKDNLKENTDNEYKNKIKDEFSEFDDYFETVQKIKDNKSSSRIELENVKNHLEIIKEKAHEEEKSPSKDEKFIEYSIKNDKNLEKHKIGENKHTEKIIDNKVNEKILVKDSKEPKDNEYNFDDSFPGGIPDKFGGDPDLKKQDKNIVKNDIEYNYDDFIVDSQDNNLFPKGKK